MTLSFRVTWDLVNLKIDKNIKSRAKKLMEHTVALSHVPEHWSPVTCTGYTQFTQYRFWSCFYYCRYFFQFQSTGTPRSVLSFAHCLSVLQKRRWVSVWTHSSTVTRSTLRLSTGERWQCVEVNTVCCCWLYWYTGKARGSPPLTKRLAHRGLHHPNGATNHTATLHLQFHLTINLQRLLTRSIAQNV